MSSATADAARAKRKWQARDCELRQQFDDVKQRRYVQLERRCEALEKFAADKSEKTFEEWVKGSAEFDLEEVAVAADPLPEFLSKSAELLETYKAEVGAAV